MLEHTILKINRHCRTHVLERHQAWGWFYPRSCSREAKVGEMVLVGGVQYCCNWLRLNFSSCTRSQFTFLV